ncbi:MAG: PLP-dependent aminotransferase family protein [Pseudomonadales bacterium]
MGDALIYLDADSELNLQAQIRQKLVDAISKRTFPVGRRLPSSRKLAEQLSVARNTVVLVYQQLIDEGYLVSRERSGIYVNEKILHDKVGFEGRPVKSKQSSTVWRKRLRSRVVKDPEFSSPPNWQQYPYPFIDGQFDKSLYPIKEWREASRQAMAVAEIHKWAGDSGDVDDPMLIEEIRTKVLPRRGIHAEADEILLTVGAQQALYILAKLLVDTTTSVAVEEPGYPGMRELLAQRGAPMVYQPVDEDGLQVDSRIDGCQVVYVTPSHQTPTTVTMSLERRQVLLAKAEAQDMLIIEDDFEFESNYLGHPHPALRSMDNGDRVIYVSCLSKVLSPGLRIGYMVAAPELIAEARKLRRLMVNHPPRNNQRTAAFFLSLGNYDAFIMHLHDTFRERWTELRKALNYYMVEYADMTPAQGGTSFWVKGPDNLDVKYLTTEAARRGILIEPVDHYYATAESPDNCFRLGVSSLPAENIREGIEKLAELIQELSANKSADVSSAKVNYLRGDQLKQTMTDVTLLCKTIYGDPCTIELFADGSMKGVAGYSNEDRDEGRWWVEGDHWCRQWNRWSYAEKRSYRMFIKGSKIQWFDEDGSLVETAAIRHEISSSSEEPSNLDS